MISNYTRRGFTLPEILIVAAIVAILATIVVPGALRARVSGNDASARQILKVMSTATESYSSDNGGAYPTDITDLTGSNPPYLNIDYCDLEQFGFTITCSFSSTDYTYTATPLSLNLTGSTTYTIVTGGFLSP